MPTPALLASLLAVSLTTTLAASVSPQEEITPSPNSKPARLTLEQAMADPAWLGAFPERVRWTADGRLLFDRRIGETDERETLDVDPATGETRTLSLDERVAIVPTGVWNRDRTRMATTRDGDLVIVDTDGTATQITRTTAREGRLAWLADGRLSFERDGTLVVRDLDTGVEIEPVDVRFADPPEPPKDPEGLAADQRRLFETLRDAAERREAARLRGDAAREATTHDVVGPVYLPPNERETGRHLSPDARWMLVELAAKNRPDAKRDDMAIWVTDEGYVTHKGLRPKVGTENRTAERLVLIDLVTGEAHDVDLDDLPERRVDRLAAVRVENGHHRDTEGEEGTEGGLGGDGDDVQGVAGGQDDAVVDVSVRLETLARSAAEAEDSDDDEETPTLIDPRPASVMRVSWHPDGGLAAVMLRSLDNKDRWIVAIDPEAAVTTAEASTSDDPDESAEPTEAAPTDASPANDTSTPTPSPWPSVALRGEPIQTIHHLHDPAWINWSFNEMDWSRDGSRLWFLSEGDGWSDLLAWMPGDDDHEPASTPLVTGAFEVRDVTEHPTDGTLFFQSNRDDPSVWRLERFDPATGWSETIAGGDGMIEDYTLSPDGRRLAFTQSTLEHPAELFVVDLPTGDAPAASPRRLTESISDTFATLDWQPATLVDIPGRHGRDIRGRLYLPPDDAPTLADGRHPCVLFVHGAGYLQNGHAGWSRYFREGFFHDVLAREGFVVLDLDYRASSGYGRDWRTAIARDMGPCELDDYEDGVAWLVEHHGVDPERVGIYGGSYGGFTTLMGLLTRPGTFKAGAALRPVTDWAFYNDGYTANILNTPQVDPLAYRRSSPIEHADGLEDELLICHGMVDDNVPFSDTVRLAQRFIELGKTGWEVAIYPVEPHGFREESSWIDEYRRIHELFDRVLWRE